MNWPELAVLVVTYDRIREVCDTIDSLKTNLHYAGNVSWHICDDGTSGNYVEELIRKYPELKISATITNRLGWGANVNKGLRSIDANYIYLNEDDYVAKWPINLSEGVALLEARKELGVIRYDGLAGHVGLTLQLKEAKTAIGKVNYMEIDLQSSSHLHVYSNRPHLRHRRLHDTIGLYATNLRLGKTEVEYTRRVKASENCPGFAILEDGIPRAFNHIGKSRQLSDEDVGGLQCQD